AELAVGDVSRNLVRLFFATTSLKKDPGVEAPAPVARPVNSVAIVGAGFMGAAIGGVAVAHAGVDVRFRDTDLPRVGQGLRTARRILDERLKRRRITKFDHRRQVALLSGSAGYDGFRRADLVIEAVFEDLAAKHDVVRNVEAVVGDECVVASNTSTIPIARIAEVATRPERILGMHFFSPVDRMPLLEVIATDRTAPWATVTAVGFGRRMGKTVIVVRDHPGFWVNRILAPYLNEAGRLLAEGMAIEDLDAAMVRFGFPVGPLTLLDEVGLDVASKSAEVLYQAFGERLARTPGVHLMSKQGRFGRKSGAGFYRYHGGRRQGVDPSAYEVMGVRPGAVVPLDEATRRMVYAMLNEAVLALQEGVVRSARDGDVGAVFGIGYPAFRGGPLRYLDSLGLDQAVAELRRLEAAWGARFHPAPLLVQMADSGSRFHGPA
ncbi:MAG TPA: 3-hydroxyacyl-CoA dehydrogenase NAD-binding domain-containing protein, partial [Gemmatimonadales bacterium]|nr:3-hydroxyacyl-CoA dehydrogenase NAD-binding domain-containing protein [Gemmatimonadales bacterium]